MEVILSKILDWPSMRVFRKNYNISPYLRGWYRSRPTYGMFYNHLYHEWDERWIRTKGWLYDRVQS